LLRPKDRQRTAALVAALKRYEVQYHPLPGVAHRGQRDALIQQMLESIHRVEYVGRIRQRHISPSRADPTSDAFDPLKAAILHYDAGFVDEAFWLVFIFVHFGKSARTGWRLARDVYGSLGGTPWTWARISVNPRAFRNWLAKHQSILQGGDGVSRQFGPHRHYVSIDANAQAGTGAAFVTYVEWVGPTRSHRTRIQQAIDEVDGDARMAFDVLYRSMASVKSFGRLGRFDYLTMLGKLQFAALEPGSAYMSGATGPIRGARLLFGDQAARLSTRELDSRLIKLAGEANVGMQVMEDSICNWQKNPNKFVAFRG
jgi:Alpha-glutamyl/putrescinyl thymine pyrophosphorylase clade 3